MPNGRLVRQALLAKLTGKRPTCRPRPRWGNCISDLAWSRLDVEPADLKLLLTVRYSKLSCGCCPATLPRGKLGMKMNEMNNIYVSLFTGV